MENFHWESIGYFSLLSITVFYQQRHAKTFQGASVAFGALLSIFGFVGMLVEFAYLGYYAWNISWWAAIVVLIIGVLSGGLIGGVLERFLGSLVLSLAGFITLPVCGYLMFRTLPV